MGLVLRVLQFFIVVQKLNTYALKVNSLVSFSYNHCYISKNTLFAYILKRS